jgi:hypothetical protein
MIIADRGPTLAEAAIVELEAAVGARLPDDYRQFLLQMNGGRPRPNVDVDVPGLPGTPTDIQVFLGLARPEESERIDMTMSWLSERVIGGLMPIARDSGGSVFCLSLRSHDRGAVLFCDLQEVFADFGVEPMVYLVAESFKEFLSRLHGS